MLIDLDNLFWTDIEDSDDVQSTLTMGFSIIVEIFKTDYAISHEMCNRSEKLNKSIKYTAVFNGQGNTFEEMETAFDSNFEEIPFPEMFPVISQSDSINLLKEKCMKYIEIQFGATKDSNEELTKKLEDQDEVLKFLIDKYMNLFSIKNELN